MELSDEETSQDRAMIDNAPQSPPNSNPLVQYAQFNAAMGSDSESEGLGGFLGRRFKRRAPGEATDAVRTRRRTYVVESSSESSAYESSSTRSSRSAADVQTASELRSSPADDALYNRALRCAHCMRLWLRSIPPPELEDDGWPEGENLGPGDVDQVEEDFVTKCVIVPLLPRAGGQLSFRFFVCSPFSAIRFIPGFTPNLNFAHA
jgi:hypothetical protein